MKAIELLEFLEKGFKDGELESYSDIYFDDCEDSLIDIEGVFIDKDKDMILNKNDETRFK